MTQPGFLFPEMIRHFLFFSGIYIVEIRLPDEVIMRKRLLSLFLIFVFILSSCRTADDDTTDSFRQFTEDLFCSQVCSDSLTLNYTLSHPERYGICSLPDGLLPLAADETPDECAAYENLLKTLESFDKDKLDDEHKLLYEILAYSLENSVEGQSYRNFFEDLGPVSGIQAQLPVLLCEYRIEDAADLSQYFSILQSIPSYFDFLAEREKSKQLTGTLPARSTLSHIGNQCREWLYKDGSSLLISVFNTRASSFSFLDEAGKKKAIKKNKRLVEKKVVPAYRTLLKEIEALMPLGTKDGALCHYPGGKPYYAYLVRTTTGSSMDVPSLFSSLKEMLENSRKTLTAYAVSNPSLFSSCLDYTNAFQTPEQILNELKEKTSADFPIPSGTSCTIKYVDKSLEEYLSPAFYLTPPIDNNTSHVIYVNNSSRFDRSSLYSTLAHEGYPGHLLQNAYMQQKKLPVLRYVLSFGGYSEGWASYSEIYSCRYLGASEKETEILQNSAIADLCLYGLSDIGVHYFGWGNESLYKFLKPYGISDPDTAEKLRDTIVDEPASYLKYSVGYLEFTRLKELFQEKDGSTYTDMRFHTFVLDMGEAPFSILESHMDTWLRNP